jgi:hypothetical protein
MGFGMITKRLRDYERNFPLLSWDAWRLDLWRTVLNGPGSLPGPVFCLTGSG